jgi:hypothetical protein
LRRIETLAREASGNPDLVLADCFDFVGGTSAGALIAVCIALGRPVDQIERLFNDYAGKIFRHPRLAFMPANVRLAEELLKNEFGEDTTLDSQNLRTLLMVVIHNMSTASPWPLTNNRAAKYNALPAEHSNLNFRLWELVRASTAAPIFFPPVEMSFNGERHYFVDGGLTSLNNPAYKLLQMASLPAYNLQWKTGKDHLLLVSVGCGQHSSKQDAGINWVNPWAKIRSAKDAFVSMIHASIVEQDLNCRAVSHVVAGHEIDSEVGNPLGSEACLAAEPLMTYARYSINLNKRGHESLDVPYDPSVNFALNQTACMDKCIEIGQAIAEREVKAAHFAPFWGTLEQAR